ncbi:hypothetical protein AFM18_04410 [Achromobacter spanius]|uniref:Uncharacterized protein n=1 Tax=Achromobacter spanius TaxID=217203 RepID=A0AAW3I8E5_9BURK|nr:hypothetical protein AFM18_04410 [Achromobacter spanius]
MRYYARHGLLYHLRRVVRASISKEHGGSDVPILMMDKVISRDQELEAMRFKDGAGGIERLSVALQVHRRLDLHKHRWGGIKVQPEIRRVLRETRQVDKGLRLYPRQTWAKQGDPGKTQFEKAFIL